MHILLHPISRDESMQQCLLRLGRHREGRHPVTQPLLIAGIYHKLILGIFHLTDIDSSISTVYQHIRKYSIPTRQIGNFVYVPKKEIDNLYKGMKR